MYTYGAFGLTETEIDVMVIVAVVTLAVAMLLYYIHKLVVGTIVHIASLFLVFIGLITAWTLVDWMALDGIIAMWALIGSVVIPSVWVVLGIRCLSHQ
jgi:hypothetical protein